MGSANSADTLEPTIATSTPKKHDARRHAYLAYLHIMTKPNHPQVGTAEHRAIKLFRDYYPNARANGKSSKFRSARMATIRRYCRLRCGKRFCAVSAKWAPHSLMSRSSMR